MDEELKALIARLVAQGPIPRSDKDVLRLLGDNVMREAFDRRIAACGLVLLDNPFASHVSLGVQPDVARAVFRDEDRWLSNSLGLNKTEVALLAVFWALLILPKRARQQQTSVSDDQSSSRHRYVATERVSETVLHQEFSHLGKISYLRGCFGTLARHKFIVRERGDILEGPLLDLAFDYNVMAPRIIEGALGDIQELIRKNQVAVEAPASGADREAEGDADV